MSSSQRFPLQGQVTYDNGPLQGEVIYEDRPHDSFWNKAWKVLKDAGHVMKEALPYVIQAAAYYRPSSAYDAQSYSSASSCALKLVESNAGMKSIALSHSHQQARQPVSFQSDPVVGNALKRWGQSKKLKQPVIPDWRDLQARNSKMLDQIASAQGLPSYEQFHWDYGVAYDVDPKHDRERHHYKQQAGQQSSGFIPEDYQQIMNNLSQAQQPLSLAEQLQRQQALQLTEREQAKHRQWAMQKADELIRSPISGQTHYQAQASKSREEVLIEKAFQDPRNPERNILEQANSSERLAEGKLSQAELNLDRMLSEGKITPTEYQELAVAAKKVTADNWLRHDGKRNGDGILTYRGVKMDEKVASLVAYADAKRYWGKERHLTLQELAKAAKDMAVGIYDFFIGDDIKTLSDPNATMLAKVLAGGSLALTLGGGFVEKSAAKLIFKGSEKLAVLFAERGVKYLGKVHQVEELGNAARHAEQLEEARQGLSKALGREIGPEHEMMKELRDTHVKLNARGGAAEATEIYLTPDKQKVIFRTQINKASNAYDHIIWTSAVETKVEGKVILRGHENYKLSSEKAVLDKYKEYIPGPNLPSDTVIKRSRSTRELQAISKSHHWYGEVEDRMLHRWDKILFQKGEP